MKRFEMLSAESVTNVTFYYEIPSFTLIRKNGYYSEFIYLTLYLRQQEKLLDLTDIGYNHEIVGQADPCGFPFIFPLQLLRPQRLCRRAFRLVSDLPF
jgi:hypothetical protein